MKEPSFFDEVPVIVDSPQKTVFDGLHHNPGVLDGFRFVVPGDPVPCARARVVRCHGGAVRAFTPKATVNFEERVRNCAVAAGAKIMDGPLLLVAEFYFTMPKGRCRKKAPRPCERKWTRPDWDNLGKGVADALNGVCFRDDGQIAEATVRKYHAAQGDGGKTVVTVIPLPEEE